MKIKILNVLMVLAALLNILYGWELGCLLSRKEPGVVLYETSQTKSPAVETNWQVCRTLSALEGPGSAEFQTEVLPGVQSDEWAELERRIEKVAEQMSKMQFSADAVLLIRADGDRE